MTDVFNDVVITLIPILDVQTNAQELISCSDLLPR